MATSTNQSTLIISKHTHHLVYENDNQLLCQEDKVLLQEKKTGKLIYVRLTEEVAKAFDMQLQDDTEDDPSSDIEKNEAAINNDSLKLWTTERIIFLIETIETFSNRLDTEVKKHVWEKISKKFNENFGMNISYKQAESKWKSLKRTYKSVLLHNNTSGKNRRHWEFFNKIHAFMHKRPEITPVATCSSFSGLQSPTTNIDQGIRDTTPASTSANVRDEAFEPSTPQTTSFSRKRRQRESEVSKRHSEKMARLDRFNELFEKMIEKM